MTQWLNREIKEISSPSLISVEYDMLYYRVKILSQTGNVDKQTPWTGSSCAWMYAHRLVACQGLGIESVLQYDLYP